MREERGPAAAEDHRLRRRQGARRAAGRGPLATGDNVVGTPAYICPEQTELGSAAVDPDTRCDVYALGVVLYELIAGVPPFDVAGKTFVQLVRAVSEDVPRPSTRVGTLDRSTLERIAAARRIHPPNLGRTLRQDLDWVILKAVARDRSRRYPSAAALAEDLRRHLRHEPVEACPPSAAYRLAKLVRRHTAATVATALALLALVLGLVGTTVAARRARREAERANREAAAASAVSGFLDRPLRRLRPGAGARQHRHRPRAARRRRASDLDRARVPAAHPRRLILVSVSSLLIGGALNASGIERPAIYGTVDAVAIPLGAFILLISVGLALRFRKVGGYLREAAAVAAIKFAVVPILTTTLAWGLGFGRIDGGASTQGRPDPLCDARGLQRPDPALDL